MTKRKVPQSPVKAKPGVTQVSVKPTRKNVNPVILNSALPKPPLVPAVPPVSPPPLPSYISPQAQVMKTVPEPNKRQLIREGYGVNGVNKALVLHKQILVATEMYGSSKQQEGDATCIVRRLKDTVKEVFASREVLKLGIIPIPHGLIFNESCVVTEHRGNMWAECGVRPGMRVLSIGTVSISSSKHLDEMLRNTPPRTDMIVEVQNGTGRIADQLSLAGSWGAGTALSEATLDIVFNVPSSLEWSARLNTYLQMKGEFIITKPELSNENETPPTFLLEDTQSGLLCGVYMTTDLPGLNHVWEFSNAVRKVCQVMKMLNKSWGYPVTSHVLNLLLAAFDTMLYSHELGWVTDCSSLGSCLLGFLYLFGVAINWEKVAVVPSLTPTTQATLRSKTRDEPPFTVVDPFTGRSVVEEEQGFEMLLTYMGRTAAVLKCNERTLDHVMPVRKIVIKG